MIQMTKPIIELRGVSQQFGSQQVLRDLSLEVFPGETLVIIGESGCGKSVTTKLMAALLSPSSGEVLWDGLDVKELAPRELKHKRERFGYLFQGGALFDSLNVYENIAFGLRQQRLHQEKTIQDIVYSRLKDIGLSPEIVKKYPAELSGGMRKRVALARALAVSPQVMLYDEPTTGLDPIMTDVINHLIVSTKKKSQVTSIVVTHEMSTVRQTADRVVMLYPLSRLEPDENQVIFTGSYAEAVSHPDSRVSDFVQGKAGARLLELAG
jgi:phospholipid/cholesterol/gamma-HCH transport system ATP-binding protein